MCPGACVIISAGRLDLGYGLGGDAAAPEDGDFAGTNVYGLAPVGAVDVLNPDGGGVAGVDGGAVDAGDSGQ